MGKKYKEVDEPRASLIAALMEVEGNEDLFDLQLTSDMFKIAWEPLESNSDVQPFLDGDRKVNVAMTCRGIEIFNIVLSECLDNGM